MDKPSSRRIAPRCCHCGTPIGEGEPRWAGDPQDRAWHYRCAEEQGLATRVTSSAPRRMSALNG